MSRFGDKCNRTACNEPHDNIRHSHSDHAYCLFCARAINDANRNDPIFTKEAIKAGIEKRMKRYSREGVFDKVRKRLEEGPIDLPTYKDLMYGALSNTPMGDSALAMSMCLSTETNYTEILDIDTLMEAKYELEKHCPAPEIEWHCGYNAANRLRVELTPSQFFNPQYHALGVIPTFIDGMKFFEDHTLDPDVFEMRDTDGNVLQRWSL